MKRPVVLLLSAFALLVAGGCGPDLSESEARDHGTQAQAAVPGCTTSVTPPYIIYHLGTPISVAATAEVVCDSVQPVIDVGVTVYYPAGPKGGSRGMNCYNASSCEVEVRDGYVSGVWESRGTSVVGGDTLPISASL